MSDKYTTEELNGQDRPLVEQLERMYGAQSEDAQSLARIRTRIVQNGAGPLPFPQPTPATEQSPVQLRKQPTKETDMRFIRTIASREKPWQRRLSMLAAAFFVVILVGSLVLVLARRPQGNVAGLPPLQPGWRQVVLLSGSSSKIFTHQGIVLSTLWGMSFGCVGQGKVDIEFDGQINNSASGTCQKNTGPVISAPYGPQTIELETSVHTIQTVKVTVSGSINWYLQLSNATVTPSPLLSELLAPGSGWQETGGMSTAGTGESNLSYPYHGITLPDGKTVYPRIWGIVVVCSGTSKVSIQLDPPVKGVQIPTPVCNEQPTLDIVHFASPFISVSTDSKVVWQIRILACTDENACLKHQ
jgi:hypothetical protein